ncbi:MAG: hypothetical protein RMZ41_003620 [Nostoc sp. DedVER02]|uniref:hypothetical protein n=1 Tax=unclassified Nostoc TaxID=2593658 RepID=UPI002AD55407|nr:MULTISPECIES: hypothetical protein [unclassified Nostoc]MDZ7986753.1 hypothetical protein [Nostoc sp. DedVER02]MDZ8115655.1 hypothetical protein [Nostoc sp. DedVER01b]
MNANSLSISQEDTHSVTSSSSQINVQIAQEEVYSFFMEIVKTLSPDDVLREFKGLFIEGLDLEDSDYIPGIYSVFLDDNEQELCNTLKRCCYIIVNNWKTNRKDKYIQELVNLFVNENLKIKENNAPIVKTCKTWLENFVNSKDYQELKLFAAKYDESSKGHWANRYSSYLLIDQSVNKNNPIEQQEAARKLSKQIKEKFKFELAMYIARSQSPVSSATRYKNPSVLGDQALRLIKAIVLKRGVFSHENIAHIFIKQTQNQTLEEFKINLEKYLFLSVGKQESVEAWKQQFITILSSWKKDYDREFVTKELFLRTCNRVIDCLTIENGKEPSSLFLLLITQGHALTLVIILLKIILICKNSRRHLETRIAHLIRFYENYPEEECKGVINFMEIFNITFAIYAENVEYNLIKMEEKQSSNPQLNLDGYRVFSQMKVDRHK